MVVLRYQYPINSQTQGFSLLEVLVALVILAVSFTAAFMSNSANLKHIMYLQDKTAANFVAMNIIAQTQLHLNTLTIDNPQLANNEIMFNKIWHWEATLIPVANSTLLKINVQVKQSNYDTDLADLTGYMSREKT